MLYRGGYFRLRILCLEERQCHWGDIKEIVASQPDLRLFGFHRRHKIFKSLLTIAQNLHHDPSRPYPMPTIFMLDFYGAAHTILELLPFYHRPGEALQVFSEIEKCFDSLNKYTYTLKLNLFGISEKNINLFREVIEAVAIHSPKSFHELNIVVHQTSIQVRLQYEMSDVHHPLSESVAVPGTR